MTGSKGVGMSCMGMRLCQDKLHGGVTLSDELHGCVTGSRGVRMVCMGCDWQ